MRLPNLQVGDNAIDSTYSNEHVVLVLHHHWWNLLREVAGVAALFVVPIILVPVIGIYFTQAGFDSAKLGAVTGLIGSLWALICWQLLFVRWTDYYFDVWIITNWRIIDMDLKGLFNVEIGSMLDLDHIQEIGTHTSGILQNLLNFGDILVQTAATKRSEFSFSEVYNPRYVEHVIREAQVNLHSVKQHQSHLDTGL